MNPSTQKDTTSTSDHQTSTSIKPITHGFLLPLTFLKFWYFDAPWEMISYFFSLNNYAMQLFALPLSIKTFFRPIKNEYREGLVGFSIVMGILIKTGFILVGFLLLSILIILESTVLISFLLFPLATLAILFI